MSALGFAALSLVLLGQLSRQLRSGTSSASAWLRLIVSHQISMSIRVLLLSLCWIAFHGMCAMPVEPLKVQLVVWDGAFAPGFAAIHDGKAERVLFRRDVSVGPDQLGLRPLALLKKHLDVGKVKEKVDFYWRGIVYRPAPDGRSASVVYPEGAIQKLKLSDLESGDVVVYFRETY